MRETLTEGKVVAAHAEAGPVASAALNQHYAYRDVWQNDPKTCEQMLKLGVRRFETDLLPSSEGVPMVVHNSIIDGKNAWEWTTAELEARGCTPFDKQLDLVEKTLEGLPGEPTLFVETKGPGSESSEFTTDAGANGVSEQGVILIKGVEEIIQKRVQSGKWRYDQLPLISFNHKMLALTSKDICIGLSFAKENFDLQEEEMAHAIERPDFQTAFVDRMVQEAVDAEAFAINPDSRLVDERLVQAAEEKNIAVQAWMNFGVEEPLEDLLRWGVNVFTDCPLTAEAAKQKRLSPPTP